MMRLQAWLGSIVVASSMALAPCASAQARGVSPGGLDSLRAAVGTRVRVSAGDVGTWRTGTLGSVNERTLTLLGPRAASIPTPRLLAVQRSMGRRRFDGGVIGFPIGAVLGGAAGYFIGDNARKNSQPNGSQRSVGLAIGAAAGGAIGALIGAAFAPERWRNIHIR